MREYGETLDLFGDDALTAARAERDEGLTRVSARGPALTGFARKCLNSLPHGVTLTGEDLRTLVERSGMEAHHPNAWGAVTMTLIREGRLVATGLYVPMRAPGSHARRTPVYRVASVH